MGKAFRVYTLLGDGEIQEGEVWETCMFAAHNKLDNLVVVIDNNSLQIYGPVAQVMSPYPIDEKLKAFGFHVEIIDGQDFGQLESAFEAARCTKGQPATILIKTIQGKGVSYKENNAGWHGKAPNDDEYVNAMQELNAALAEFEGS